MSTNRRKNKFVQSQEIIKRDMLQTRKNSLKDDLANFLETNDVTSSSRLSRQSSLLQKEQNIFKRKRQKMEILIMKYEQQKKCIQELQEYIDELESEIRQKTKENDILTSEKQVLAQKLLVNQKALKGFGVNNQRDIESMAKLMSQQIYLFENQRKKWQCQLKIKANQFESERELLQQKSRKLRQQYLSTVSKIQHKMAQKQNILYERIGTLQISVRMLEQENKTIKMKNMGMDEIDRILQYRREITQLSLNEIKQSQDEQIFKQKISDLTEQLKKIKKQYYNLECKLEGKQFQLQCKQKQIQAKNILISEIQQKRKKQNLSNFQEQQQLKQLLQQKQLKLFQIITENQQIENRFEVKFQQLKKKSSTHSQQNNRNQKLKQLRKREYKQLQKLNNIFDKLNFQ